MYLPVRWGWGGEGRGGNNWFCTTTCRDARTTLANRTVILSGSQCIIHGIIRCIIRKLLWFMAWFIPWQIFYQMTFSDSLMTCDKHEARWTFCYCSSHSANLQMHPAINLLLPFPRASARVETASAAFIWCQTILLPSLSSAVIRSAFDVFI